MKRTIVILAGCLAGAAAFANDNGNGNGNGTNIPFQIGEKLSYQIMWGPLVAGRATLTVAGIEPVGTNDCYHLTAVARTSGILDLLFHVENRIDSWLDVHGLFTRRYRQKRVEGSRRYGDDSSYDYAAGQIVTTNFITGQTQTAPLTGPVQDMVSCLYFVRTQPLLLDVEKKFPINLSGKRYDVSFRPDARKTLYFRPTGNISALRIEPNPTINIVAANKGRMWFWVSDDNRKLPLLLASDMKIGSAKFVLTDIGVNPPKPAPTKTLADASSR